MRLTHSSPFLPRSNSRIERQNKIITNILRCVCANNPRTWDDMLPLVIFNINNTRCRSTGYSPHEIVYGRQLRHLADLSPPPSLTLDEFNANLAYTQQQAMAAINQHNLAMLRDYDATPRTPSRLQPGDVCFWRRPALDNPNANKKLQTVNRGPYRVLHCTPHQATLHDITTDRPLRNPVSISQLVRPALHLANQQ
jgi:hypothetical protein